MKLATFPLLLLLGLISQPLFTQSPHLIDSLEKVLQLSASDTLKVDLMVELSWQWQRKNDANARSYAEKAQTLAKAKNYEKGQADALISLGALYMNDKAFDRALTFFTSALHIRKSLGKQMQVASTYNNLGLLYKFQQQYDQAIDYYQQGLSALSVENDSKLKAVLYNNTGTCYLRMGRFEEAIQYLLRGIEIREQIKDFPGAAYSYLDLGSYYLTTHNLSKAIDSYLRSLDIFTKCKLKNGQAKCYMNLGACSFTIKKYQEALDFYQKALLLDEFLDQDDLALIYKNTGAAYDKLQQYDLSMNAFQKGLRLFSEIGDAEEQAAVYYNIGYALQEQNKPKMAVTFLQKARSSVDSLQTPILQSKVYDALASIHAKLQQNEKALFYSQRYNEIQDSLNNSFVNALNYKLNYEEIQKENALLREAQLISSSRQQLIVLSLTALVVIISAVSFFVYFSIVSRQKRQAAERAAQDAYREIDDLLRDQEIKINYARLEGQDKERLRVAQDLHDGLGGMLSTVKLYFSHLDSKLSHLQQDNLQQFNKATELLDNACEEVRKIAYNMHSGVLSNYGLKAELDELVHTIQSSSPLQVNLFTHGFDKRLRPEIEVNLYRIIQELVSNALKHSRCKKLVLQLNQLAGILNVIVEDDGIGFDPEAVKDKKGLGLKNIRTRVNDMGGKMHVDASPGRGTTVTIDIPDKEV
ncbi:MAG: tetratricopeptide repeat protein [Bacteroidota bacterium]